MRVTKFGHACVRLEHEGRALVLDPGMFTGPEAVEGADAVLITHEHPDHWTPDLLRRADAPVVTIAAVAAQIAAQAPDLAERVTVVAPGEHLDLAGYAVRACHELHAVIHPEYPRVHNSGYLVGAGGVSLFHPGDALDGPPEPVDLLLAPVSAPWMRIADAIDFARRVGAPRNLAIHDAVYSEAGLGIADHHLRAFLEPAGQSYTRLADGQDL